MRKLRVKVPDCPAAVIVGILGGKMRVIKYKPFIKRLRKLPKNPYNNHLDVR